MTYMTCPPQKLWHDLGRTWMLVLIDVLREEKKGFNELQEIGISSKVLADRLQTLEDHGLVKKRLYEQDSVQRSEYSLTQKAADLFALLDAYKEFARKYDESLLCGDISCSKCPYIMQKQ